MTEHAHTAAEKTSDGRRREGGKPFRSKLLPFAAEIAKWQREGKTYGQMAFLLREKHGLHVHPDTINSFVLVRVRARKKPILPASFLREIAPPVPTPAKVTLTAPQSAQAHLHANHPATLPKKSETPMLGIKSPPRGMLAPQHSKFRDSTGRPVPPPPDPNKFRSENL